MKSGTRSRGALRVAVALSGTVLTLALASSCGESSSTCLDATCSPPVDQGQGGEGGAAPTTVAGAGGETTSTSCVGVTCDAPPANRCESAKALRAYDTVGSCDDGVCSYASQLIDCACSDDACAGDLCESVTCDSPPKDACPTARSRRTYAESGVCLGGSCDYAETNTDCPPNQACDDGKCGLCADDASCGAGCAPCDEAKPKCLAADGASSCVECLEDQDCHGGRKCKAVTHTCVAPSCDGLPATCGKNAAEDCCTSLLVPEGTFNRDNDAKYPAHVSAFSLDKFEVTVGRFRSFVAQYQKTGTPEHGGTNVNDPESTGWDKALDQYLPKDAAELKSQLANCDGGAGTWTTNPGSNETKPISCVSWFAAEAFCIWDGGRLPTEAEWNYAAAGGDEQRYYPWSQPADDKTISSAYAVYGTTGPLAVGSKQAHNARWGHADMAGNMGEWIADWNSVSYPVPCDNCEVHTVDPFKIYRGGSWQHPAESVTTLYRAFNNNNGTPAHGLRCARTP